MTAMKEEEGFPRGRSTSSKPALRKVKDRLFKKYKKPKKKTLNSFFEENQVKGRFKESLAKGKKDLEPSHAIRPLTYQSLEEGMVVVGRVREIHPYHLFVCLPGKLSAKVPITAISQPYSNSLARLQKLEITQKDCPPLGEIFTEGQAVVCSIVEVKKDGSVLAVNASLDPALVNKERSHHVIRAGHTLVAAVRSVEDHGYTLDTGIAGLTTFLKFGNAEKHVELRNQGRPLVVGELVRCVVIKCVTGRSASRAEVTLDPKVMANAVVSDGNAQTLHPGTNVGCVVQQSSKVGLVVTVGHSRAYVEAAQLPGCWSSHRYIQPEEELTATVLYSLPNTDFQITARPTYLTLKDLDRPSVPKLAIGDVIEAKVTASGRKGLVLCLGEKKDKKLGNKGFVSIRRLGEIIPKENIAKRFPKGTVVTTKILAYDFMEEIYNCTLEKAQLAQTTSVAQVRVGDRLTCWVVSVESRGLRLQLGPVRLYAFREHAADEPCAAETLRRLVTPGDAVDARVLRVNPISRQIYVTLKETLIRSAALMSYEAASRGECYWGTVKKVNFKSKSIDVAFYNDVTGVLHQVEAPLGDFKPGQLIKCFIKKVDPEQKKLLLSLTKPKGHIESKQLTIGEFYQLVVSDINEDYLEVSPCDFEGIEGLIPKCHLHEPDRFAEGDFIRAWLYYKKDNIHYFSPNPAIEHFFKNKLIIKPRFRVYCCVTEIGPEKVTLLTSVPDIPTVTLEKKEFPEDKQPSLHQLVRLYVVECDRESKTLKLSYYKPTKQADDKSNEGQYLCAGTSEKPVNEEKSTDKSQNPKNKKKKKEINMESEPKNHFDRKEEINEQSSSVPSENPSKEKVEKTNKENSWTVEKADSKVHSVGCDCIGNFKVEDQSEIYIDKVISKDTSQNKKEKKTKTDTGAKQDNSKKSRTKINNLSEHEKEEESDLNTSDFDSDNSSDEIVQREKRKKSETVEDEEGGKKSNKKLKKIKNFESESDTKLENKTGKKSKKRKNSVDDSDAVDEPKVKNTKTPSKPKPTLSESGFLWDIKPEDLSKPDAANEDNDEEEEESTVEKKKKRSAAERREAAREEEARLRRAEQSLLAAETDPQSAEQFDRAVLARPDDDELWIKYMSHHLQATEIEKARAVGRRALQTISQRLETERLNIWIALLNLENLFGTQESLKNTLDEALRTNDEFSVYTKMLNIYRQANKAQEAEQLVHTMLRKFRESLDCWVASCEALMGCGLADKARNLLQRAITALPAKQHVNLLCKFALLENQHGNSEQAQTLFEHILTTYPKRTDIWNVYVDMLVKSGKVDVARQILERATKQKLPPRKMKMLFNKWISFEENNGTPEKVEHVRKQALAYVNNITNKLDD